MNKILHLLDNEFVLKYFKKKILPLYPDFQRIESIRIIPHKKLIWETTYHTVFEYETCFIDNEGRKTILPIFCTAHSNESRKIVYTSLKYLWNKGFSAQDLSIPHPLFYSSHFHATFYRGVEGKNLYYYIKKNNRDIVEEMMPRSAALFHKLHSINNDASKNLNKNYSRIRTVRPGSQHIIERIKCDHPDYYAFYKNTYEAFIKNERKFFNSTKTRWLIHGDAHPENIIRMSERKVALIDFTDLSLADYARDLGSFTQQLEYMIGRKMQDSEFGRKMSKKFTEAYFDISGKDFDDSVKDRIKLYYNWTAMRTATHFLLKVNTEPPRAEELIKKVSQSMNISY